MRKYLSICLVGLLFLAIPAFAAVEEGNHELTGSFTQADLVTALQNGTVNLKTARQVGLLVFSTPFNRVDGHGDGPFDIDEWNDTANNHGGPIGFGHRPTLQGNGQFLRVNGLDAQSCNECHVFVKHSTQPPEIGIAGVGGVAVNAIIMPSMIDVADSFDNRTQYATGHVPDLTLSIDGVADYNGRFANPPFLFGGGGVELLAKEMTYELQQLLAAAEAAPAGAVVSLDTHGVNFGYIVSQGGGSVEIHNQGINEDLVVRPFGRKGENFSMRDFDRGAMQFHFGIQPEEVFGHADEDGDNVTDEVTIGEMSALHIFDVSNPRPRTDSLSPQALLGKTIFNTIGCTMCHKPNLVTQYRQVPVSYPEIPNDPTANIYYAVDLTKAGFGLDPHGTGVIVPLYADLKRHYMGPGLEETFERAGEIPQGHFTTARLWGIADTEPYLHDGRATTLHQAISLHGGEALGARNNYMALPNAFKEALLAFLRTLRTPDAPNQDLVPINF